MVSTYRGRGGWPAHRQFFARMQGGIDNGIHDRIRIVHQAHSRRAAAVVGRVSPPERVQSPGHYRRDFDGVRQFRQTQFLVQDPTETKDTRLRSGI